MEARVLISVEQIRRIARQEKLGAGVVEKDYALSWLLKGYFLRHSGLETAFVLKGGTAIRKAYFPQTWRFSEDLDFTVAVTTNADGIRGLMEHVFEALLNQSGIRYTLESFHPTKGTVIANVQFLGPLNFTGRIKHDISLKEKMILKPVRRTVRTNFSDTPRFAVRVYSLTEILVEKIRSIMQRGYSRDYYDVWKLFKESRFKEGELLGLLKKKCELNGVNYEPHLVFDKERLDAARSFWVQGLGYLTKELPEFDAVVADLRERLGFLNER